MASLEDMALWHERDISHSSVERVIAPDSTILLDMMIHRSSDILEKLVVYPDAMHENLTLTRGLIYSEGVLMLLVRKGLSREIAYDLVQRNAMKVWNEAGEFLQQLLNDPDVMSHAEEGEIRACFDLEHCLTHVDLIFDRVLGEVRQ
jgi:adenylosuccinate lyase